MCAHKQALGNVGVGMIDDKVLGAFLHSHDAHEKHSPLAREQNLELELFSPLSAALSRVSAKCYTSPLITYNF